MSEPNQALVEIITPLTPAEKDELEQCNKIIAEHLKTVLDVGNALRTVRDKKLYRGGFPTFEKYCETMWKISARRGYQLIEGAEVVDNLRTSGSQSLPESERVTRELAQVASEEQPKVWKKAQEMAGEKPVTAAHVRKIIKPEAESEPDFQPRKRRDKTVKSLKSSWQGSSRDARIRFMEWLVSNRDTYQFEFRPLEDYAREYFTPKAA